MPDNAEPTSPAVPSPSPVTFSCQQIIMLCAIGLLICFFLPWINFIVAVSGFDLAKQGGKHVLFWSFPLFSAMTIMAALTKNNLKPVAQITGALPFFALSYGLYEAHGDLFRMLTVGSYLSLILGLALFILPRRLK